MNLQSDILAWCKQQPLHILKHILTIKNPVHTEYIKKIFIYDLQTKPIDRLSHGYSETIIADHEKGFYVRDNNRYKKRREEKRNSDKEFLENITISRIHPFALSVKEAYIQNQGLKKCMMLISDGFAFNYCQLKQFDIKTGSGKIHSVWFSSTTVIRSFTEWIVYLFELEIYQSYKLEKGRKIDLFNHFSYVSDKITKDDIKKLLTTIISGFVEGRYNKNSKLRESIFEHDEEQLQKPLEIGKEEAPYLLTRCMDTFQNCNRSISEVVFQYEWYSEERNSKVNRVLKQLCKFVIKKFRDEEITMKGKQIQALGIKKKKKKSKRGKEAEKGEEKKEGDGDRREESEEKEEKVELKNLEMKQAQKELVSEKSDTKVEEVNQASQIFDPKLSLIPQTPQKMPKKSSKKSKPQKVLEQTMTIQKEQLTPKIALSDHKHPPEPKKSKQINERINEYILTFQQQLTLSSQSLDKYRKICLETIEQSLAEMGIPGKWSVLLFGSYSIDFSLRDSDLDVVVVVQTPGLTLNSIRQHLNVQKWLRSCNVIQIQSAKVDILQFQIMLSQLKPLKSKDKKTQEITIHVDLSLIQKEAKHEGLRNTDIMKNIFEESPTLKTICLIFKQLLSIYDLNKPFTGGIGSYILVILVYNIVKMKRIRINTNSDDLIGIIMAVCTFMTEQFQPYKTLITAFPGKKVEVNNNLELNIVDPEDHCLLNTTKLRQIDEIIGLFDQFKKMLRDADIQLMQINVEERKKMKRVFFEYWNILFRPNEEVHL